MKIEKINDNQIKFILGQQDLAQRNLQLSELEHGSEKAHELFRDMMEQAYHEHSFDSDGVPLMVEAIPITLDTLMVIVTKVPNADDLEHRLMNFHQQQVQQSNHSPLEYNDTPTAGGKRGQVAIFYFNSLDDVINVAKKVEGLFVGKSAVYKYQSDYYLILEGRQLQKASYLLSEYGQVYLSNAKSKYHLMEHGQAIVKELAIQKLARM